MDGLPAPTERQRGLPEELAGVQNGAFVSRDIDEPKFKMRSVSKPAANPTSRSAGVRGRARRALVG